MLDKKKNILFVCPTEIYGGGEVYLKTIIEGFFFSRRFGKIHFISPKNKLIQDIQGMAILHDGLDVAVKSNLLLLIFRLNKIIKAESVDIVFFNGFNECGWIAPFINARKKICTGHNNFNTFEDPFFSKGKASGVIKIMKRPFQYFFVFLAFRSFDRFICINNLVFDNLERVVDRSKLVKIPNGVDEIRRRKKPNGMLTFGRIGRLENMKGNVFLLHAFSRYRKKNDSGLLVFAGEGSEMEMLKSLSHRLSISKYVEFMGHVEKEEFYSLVDVMVSPSSYEASPLVILEALSCGVPVISTDVGGVKEILTDGYSGLIVDFGDEERLSEKMNLLAKDASCMKKLSENGYRVFSQDFRSESMITRTIEAVLENDE
jgi:glycosyltransferase involved in cell wall biosynthesis